ncbi:MAG: hypothetical protein HW380_2223 [Magnetococcales bacterium]|nr:hypothetical protein [Magnetococcales bacterium]
MVRKNKVWQKLLREVGEGIIPPVLRFGGSSPSRSSFEIWTKHSLHCFDFRFLPAGHHVQISGTSVPIAGTLNNHSYIVFIH